MNRRLVRLLVGVAVAVLASALLASAGRSAGAAQKIALSAITVNTTSDAAPAAGECSGAPGDCSLRQAIDNAQPGDTIQLSGTVDSQNVYTLTLGSSLLISKDLTIAGNGPDATFIDGAGNAGPPHSVPYRIMKVQSGVALSISGLTLQNGNDDNDENFTGCEPCETLSANGGGALFNDGGDVTLDDVAFTNNGGSTPVGGAVANSGTLNLTDVSFTNNGAGYGDGLFNHSGTVNATGVSFVNNGSGGFGGGAAFLAGGTVSLDNATIVGNGWASSIGGGIDNSAGTLTLVNDTFSGNLRGAIETDQGATTSVENTIIGAGFSEGGDYACLPAGIGTEAGATTAAAVTVDLGNNIDQDGHCNLTGTGDVSNVDPKLASIADNGGPTPTQAIVAGSPAFDAGNDAACPATDQRGTARPQGSHCDIGAFEAVRIGPPTATTEPADHVWMTTAAVCGLVNFDGEAGAAHFVWGTAADALTNSTDEVGLGVPAGNANTGGNLSGLTPATTYYYAVVADNATASVQASNVLSFTTLAGPPSVSNVSVASATDTTATIDFSIDPQGADTTYVVEYGPEANYGQQTAPVDIGSAVGAQQLNVTLTGLTPGSTYHFDVSASNATQQNVDGGDQTFATDKQITGTAGSQVSLMDAGSTYSNCPAAPTIDWGDGSSPSQGHVTCTAGQDDANDYSVTATHTYKAAGHYHLQITYSDLDVVTDQYALISPAKIQCVVPNVKGKSLAAAKRAIVAAHCAVGHIAMAASKKVRKGDVISQSPPAGKHLKKGSKVNLVVSRGKR